MKILIVHPGASMSTADVARGLTAGLKARGHPVGATGVYQAVEAIQQLRGEAGPCQIAGAEVAMTQNIGGSGATVVTHILEAE